MALKGKYKRTKKHRFKMSLSLRNGKSVEESFFDKVKFTEKCWEWKGSTLNSGHGMMGILGELILVHRFSYNIFIGKIKKGNEIHHLCENPKCINPGHLEQLTNREHILIGNGVGAINARKTHCKIGHLLPVNRICRICKNDRERKYYNQRGE